MDPENIICDEIPIVECAICKAVLRTEDTDTVVLRKRGADGVNKASKDRNSDINVNIGDTVHQLCRREHIKEQNIKKCKTLMRESPHKVPSLRSKSQQFDYQTKCFLCGEPAKYDTNSK